jgi:hypothetical protein
VAAAAAGTAVAAAATAGKRTALAFRELGLGSNPAPNSSAR